MREAGGTICLCSDGPEQTRLHNVVNEIDTNNLHGDGPGESIAASTGSNWFDPIYDAAGNMIGGPKPGDEDESTGTQQWYKYDAWNRLVEVWADGGDGDRELDGEGSDDVLVAKYRFDGLNRRIFKLLPDGEDWDRTDYYYTAQWQVIEERTKTAADETTIADKVKYQYVWGLNYIDAPVVRHMNGNNDDDTTDTGLFTDYHEYYTYDANFNVTGISGEWYVYEPYGQEINCPWAISLHNEIRFAGYRYDPETGLYHVRNRMYHPTLGRWQHRDPARYINGMSLYEYAGGSPLCRRDPLGLSFDENKILYALTDTVVSFWPTQNGANPYYDQDTQRLEFQAFSIVRGGVASWNIGTSLADAFNESKEVAKEIAEKHPWLAPFVEAESLLEILLTADQEGLKEWGLQLIQKQTLKYIKDLLPEDLLEQIEMFEDGEQAQKIVDTVIATLGEEALPQSVSLGGWVSETLPQTRYRHGPNCENEVVWIDVGWYAGSNTYSLVVQGNLYDSQKKCCCMFNFRFSAKASDIIRGGREQVGYDANDTPLKPELLTVHCGRKLEKPGFWSRWFGQRR